MKESINPDVSHRGTDVSTHDPVNTFGVLMPTDEALAVRLIEVAGGRRHEHYERTVERHELYMQLVAGVGIDKLLKQYVRRESEQLFEQRVNITQHITKAISANLLSVWNKIPRSPSGRRVLTYSGDDGESKTNKLEDRLKGFWGELTFDNWMGTRFVELQAVDPNAFVVFDFPSFDSRKGGKVEPHPFEVLSPAAVDFRYRRGNLEYVIAKSDINYETALFEDVPGVGPSSVENKGRASKKGSKFSLYGEKHSAELIQVDPDLIVFNGPKDNKRIVTAQYVGSNPGAVAAVSIGETVYIYKEYGQHGAGRVPAFRVGYVRDKVTHGATFVNPLDPIEAFLLKTVKTNSELDLVMTLLAMPQQVRYGTKCSAVGCTDGMDFNGNACSVCKGQGTINATAASSQDAITIATPKAGTPNNIPLDKLVHYEYPPVDIVRFQDEYIDKISRMARRMLFNGETPDTKQVSKTATEKNIDYDNIYDTLYPFAVQYGRAWTRGVTIVAHLTELEKGLVARYSFGKDFKLKSLDTLIEDLSRAKDLGNPALIRSINDDIIGIVHAENHTEKQRYAVRVAFDPFAGKSEAETLFLLASTFVPMRKKVLWANLDPIFDRLELSVKEGGSFYGLKREEQAKRIEAEVEQIMASIEAENPEPQLLELKPSDDV